LFIAFDTGIHLMLLANNVPSALATPPASPTSYTLRRNELVSRLLMFKIAVNVVAVDDFVWSGLEPQMVADRSCVETRPSTHLLVKPTDEGRHFWGTFKRCQQAQPNASDCACMLEVLSKRL
jgi:hypothetical protein